MNKDAGKKLIEQKVEDFEKNAAVLKKKGHGETNIRSNYIDVFFEALGWNMKSHYDVHREFAQKDNSATKKVDYAFKVNNRVKFFVEAKEANVDLVNDKDAIYQAKRYAYSTNGRAPIVILTDFEEFRVFNVVKAPAYDNTDRELLKKYSFEYTGYIENWDLIWDTFSKEAVMSGSLDALRGKIDRNTKTMDADFLEQITGWRETLARNIALRNKELKVDELNEAVQRILDRLLFIRNLEDREIEPENTLLDKTKKTEDVYRSIIPVFRSLDNVYNGLLFKKHFSEELAVDDKTLKDIIKSMCYPVSPFQFDVIEPEILGRIYEKFLGSKIRLTENHQAKIEEKMEVRKAGGVYYTPEYIVNYIVENTVGALLNKGLQPLAMTPEEIKNIKICDPACGSGSFLLGAYSYLLDYHEKWYAKATAEDKKKYKADFYKTSNGEIKVTLEKRGDILRNNIFGVDIDKEATEVAIMSLYLKMLDEGFDKGERDLFFVKGHVLPDMTENVKCGNSLIGTDYFDGKLEIDIEEMKEIKPFDWEKEFKEVFSRRGDLTPGPLRQAQRDASPDGEGSSKGGFDCVIGNPPYFNISTIDKNYYKYLEKDYSEIHTGYNDIMYYFIYKGIKILRDGGLYGVITSNYYLGNSYAKALRQFLKPHITKIVNFKDYLVFEDANIHTNIIVASHTASEDEIPYFELENKSIIDFANIEEAMKSFCLSRKALLDEWVVTDSVNISLMDKIKLQSILLGSIVTIEQGSKSGKNSVYTISNIFAQEHLFEKDVLRKNVKNSDIDPYYFSDRGNSLIYVDNNTIIKNYPNVYKYLQSNKKELAERNEVKQGMYDWFRFDRPRRKFIFDAPEKLIVPYRAEYNKFAYDNEQYFNDGGDIRAIVLNDEVTYSIKYTLGLLNSKLLNWYYGFIGKPKGKMREYFNEPMALIPIRTIDFNNPDDKQKHDSLVSLVDQMLSAQKDCRAAKSDNDKKLHEQKITMLDKKIDDLVYKLYGLTDEEIRIVEG
ncbi:MAG TPA: N-6 DNA methylase [Spirochaetota bacterium]|nr:N-6 DNA methylase [Spirochaetota bacterium]